MKISYLQRKWSDFTIGMTRNRRRSKMVVLLATSIMIMHSGAMAATYYVDSVAGLDANNGTSTSTPWKTLTKINAFSALPGDSVLFKRGSAWSGTLTPVNTQGALGSPIVFDAYGTGANPVINGNGAANAVMIWSPKYFTFQNFDVSNDATADGYRAGIRVTFVGPASSYREYPDVKIRNNDIHNVRGITVRSQGVYSTAALFIEYSATNNCQVLVKDMLIENNSFYDNKCIGLTTLAPALYASHPELWATGLIIRSNTFDQGGADHMVINGANAPLIESNAGYDAGILATPNAGSFIAGMWTCYYTTDAIFQFNEVARTKNENINGASGDSQAFDADYGTRGNQIFQYNYTHDNDGGILIMMPDGSGVKNVIYRYNLSVNDGRNTNSGSQFAMFPTVGASAGYVYNNVIYSTRPEGFKFLDNQGCYFYNNIFHIPSATIYPTRAVFSNNCYFGHIPEVNDTYKVLGDPQFVGPLPGAAGGDGYTSANTDVFKLQSTSPCINWGKSITTPVSNGGRDFWNNPLYSGTYADIGAHEVVGGNHPAPGAITITDNTDPAITYVGAWSHTADANYYNSTKSWSTTAGDYAQFTFTGTNVTLFGGMGGGFAQINVSVDGGAPTLVNCYWPGGDRARMPLYQISGLTNASHTIKVTTAAKSSGSAWTTIVVDSFQQSPGTPPTSPRVSGVDNVASASVVYTGTWTAGTGDAAFYNGTKAISSTVGSYVDFTFTGTGVKLYGSKASSYGKLSISIDGGAAMVVNCYQPTLVDYITKLYEINGLTSGAHTMRVSVATKDTASTGNTVVLDIFQALDGVGSIAVPSSADATVRDGSYATTNFGTATTLDVKLDGTSFQRESFLKFNVSGFISTTSAKLQLMPVTMNTDTAVSYIFELVTTDTWTESGVTWNTKPAGSGVILAQVPATALQVGVPVIIDITNEVRAQAAGDGVISIRIRSNTLGSLKQVSFGSKEDTTSANRPQLIIQ